MGDFNSPMYSKPVFPNLNRLSESASFVAIFEFKYASWAHGGAYTAAYTTRAYYILPSLCVPSYVYAHFAMGGAIAAGDTLSTIGGDSESGFETLH